MKASRSKQKHLIQLLLLVAVSVVLIAGDHAPNASAAVRGKIIPRDAGQWNPPAGTTWAYQLDGTINTTAKVDVFDIDGFETSAATVRKIHANGAKAICYISSGSHEDWRPDAKSFPQAVIGDSMDWEGEAWLDIRRLDLLLPIMEKRVQMCREKGFDAVEFDNVDGYSNDTGFQLTAAQQIRYNKALASLAHSHRLAAILKNDGDQVKQLEPYFDGAVVEQCYEYDECDSYKPFIKANKPVFIVEYETSIQSVCADARANKFSLIKADLDLTRSAAESC